MILLIKKIVDNLKSRLYLFLNFQIFFMTVCFIVYLSPFIIRAFCFLQTFQIVNGKKSVWYSVNREKYCSLLSNMNLVPNCPNYITSLYTLKSLDHSFLVFALIQFLGGFVKIIQISRVNPGICILNVTRFIPKFQVTLNQHIGFNKQPCNNSTVE